MPSKSELQNRIERSRERFNVAVDGVDTETLETLAVCGDWNARDVAGHLADWNTELLATADHATGGLTPARPEITSFDTFNSVHAASRKAQSWEAAFTDLHASVDHALTVLDGYSDEQLATVTPFPWGGEGPIHQLFEIAAGHINEHTEDLEHHFKSS